MGKSVFYLLDFGLIVAVVMQVEAARPAVDNHMDITKLTVDVVCEPFLKNSPVAALKGNLTYFYDIHSFHALPQCFTQNAALLIQCLYELCYLFFCCGAAY